MMISLGAIRYWNDDCDSQNLAAERSYNNLDITLKEALKHRAPVSNTSSYGLLATIYCTCFSADI